MNHPMGPTAVVEMGGIDRPPRPACDRRYMVLLLPAGYGAAPRLGLTTRGKPRCSLRAWMAETGIPLGWARPQASRPAGPSWPPAWSDVSRGVQETDCLCFAGWGMGHQKVRHKFASKPLGTAPCAWPHFALRIFGTGEGRASVSAHLPDEDQAGRSASAAACL